MSIFHDFESCIDVPHLLRDDEASTVDCDHFFGSVEGYLRPPNFVTAASIVSAPFVHPANLRHDHGELISVLKFVIGLNVVSHHHFLPLRCCCPPIETRIHGFVNESACFVVVQLAHRKQPLLQDFHESPLIFLEFGSEYCVGLTSAHPICPLLQDFLGLLRPKHNYLCFNIFNKSHSPFALPLLILLLLLRRTLRLAPSIGALRFQIARGC